jgi:aminoglycoside phosphotransferase (APT) family kinase protein
VMERRTGVVIRQELPPELASVPNAARRAAFAMVDAMASLHSVDYAAAGLADLGRPAGFAERQLAGWNKRWEVAATPDNPLPGVEEVGAMLLQRLPAAPATSLIHNDLKLDNCQFQPGEPGTVTSIFDWDMATLGDPLFDLGTLLGYWGEATDELDRSPSTGLTGINGLPSRRELAERYAESRHVPLDTIAWYEAFALWKTVIVLQQMYVRYVRGQTQDERFAVVIERQPGLLAMARETALRAPHP